MGADAARLRPRLEHGGVLRRDLIERIRRVVMLSQNPLPVEPDVIGKIRVLSTVVERGGLMG